MQHEIKTTKDNVVDALAKLNDLTKATQHIVDDWDTTATVASVSVVREGNITLGKDVQDVVERIVALEDAIKSLTNDIDNLTTRFSKSGSVFRNLADRVEVLERAATNQKPVLASRIGIKRAPRGNDRAHSSREPIEIFDE